jgi:hypothetical protein
MQSIWRPVRRRGVERRAHPRIPLAVPVRYATDQGHAGVGVLIDAHAHGVGLLVPSIASDAFHIWIQFLWFNNRMGVQGRVAFVRETPDGFHVGVQLHPLPAESADFLSGFLIPYGLRKFTYDRRHPSTFLRLLFPQRYQMRDQRRRRYLPVMIEQGPMKVWAVTEDRSRRGVVLLLPYPPKVGAPLRIRTWGSLDVRRGAAIASVPLELPPVTVYRVGVIFEGEPAGQTAGARQAPSNTPSQS